MSLGSSVASDCDGALPRCVLLVCTGQEFDDLEGIAHPCDGVGLGGNCGAESGHGVAETDCVWNDSTSLKINNSPFTCSSECSLASVPPASASHDCNGLALQEEGTATCAESYEVKSSATALTTQKCNFDGNTDTGLLFPSCVTTTLLRCSDSTIAQNEKFDAVDCTNSTVGEIASWVAPLAPSMPPATILERSRVSARTRALPV